MNLFTQRTYDKLEVTSWTIPNYWDLVALFMVLALIILLTWGARQMAGSYQLGDVISIHLETKYLPIYALKTTIRLFLALFFSLLFTFSVAPIAAKNPHAERLLIPFIDILQSVPVLSFLTITVTGFIALFKNSMLGPECAAIFGIFTSQVWNMTLSLYQGIKMVPKELREAASMFQLSPWQRFWKIEVPFSMPNLLWNMMMSMSGSWFFVIACEAFSVAGQNITLPGIGSYISLAITQADHHAIIAAIICMLLVIFLYDQLLFRPLIAWTEKFNPQEDEEEHAARSWLINLFQRTRVFPIIGRWLSNIANFLINFKLFNLPVTHRTTQPTARWLIISYYLIFFISIISTVFLLGYALIVKLGFAEIRHALLLCSFTGLRVMALILIASLIWVPIGVWIGLHPRITALVQPIIQFLAAFPADLLFPIATIGIVAFNLNVELWVAPLMVLGTQWYILFNVIAGTSQIPKELKLAAANFQVKGWLWWKRFILPGIAPSFITGAITAAGGAWNASIIAEIISWGPRKLTATGIGAYIKINAENGDFARVALGTLIMCLTVLIINRLFWKPLYDLAIRMTSED